jgi:leucyl-tRNA synthetase
MVPPRYPARFMSCTPTKKNEHRYSASFANEIEAKWQDAWDASNVNKVGNPNDVDFDSKKPKFYCLDMFPYPSGAGLHVGHPVGYIGSDILSRFKRMKGFNVLHPMGWDAFGLPAEQYAIETGVHPAKTTRMAIDTFRGQLKRIGFSYDWSREFATIDPEYYKWTQWIWLKAYDSWFDEQKQKALPISELISRLEQEDFPCGDIKWNNLSQVQQDEFIDSKRLAYLGEYTVNWCPKLATVLANEEVINGRSERGSHPVMRRSMRQWMFRITAYADRLLYDLEGLDWPESTLRMQKDWIGRSEGADIDFLIDGSDETIRVYTTRPDTIFGATFIVLAPEHSFVESIKTPDVQAYVEEARNRSDIDRMADSKEKTGIDTGRFAINPANGTKIPIWIADYVLIGYGHGAIMAVPAHDDRDHAFATAHSIQIIEVVQPNAPSDGCFAGDGVAINSSSEFVSINGKQTSKAKQTIIDWLKTSGYGFGKVNYRLRDWLFSRQRYWGEPFPIVFDANGKHYPISEASLPVELPTIDDYTPLVSNEPQPLLAKAESWVNTTAGEAGVDPSLLSPDTPVRREVNTMPGWAGSCWYELRYCSPSCDSRFVDKDAESYWMGNGVDMYIGGAEHAVRHLLYVRFWQKMLFDLGQVSSNEPFKKLFHQGLLTSFAFQRSDKTLVPTTEVEEKDGKYIEMSTGEEVKQIIAKMSKSLKNVVNPDDVIAEYGADTLRLYEMYMGPLEASAPWNTHDIVGVHRFLQRVWRLGVEEETGELRECLKSKPNEEVERALHKTIAKVTGDIPELAYNTAIASMIEFVNTATNVGCITSDQLQQFVRILSPFAPHISQELFAWLGENNFVCNSQWPSFDDAMLVASSIELPVQIMGKVRGKITVPAESNAEEVERAALADERIKECLVGLTVRKIIIVPKKIINIVAN